MIERSVRLMLTLCVIVQLALNRLAAFDREHSLGLGEIDAIFGHHVCNALVWPNASGFHLGHGALDNMAVLQRQKRDEEVHQVLVDQTCMPQATCRKRLRYLTAVRKSTVSPSNLVSE